MNRIAVVSPPSAVSPHTAFAPRLKTGRRSSIRSCCARSICRCPTRTGRRSRTTRPSRSKCRRCCGSTARRRSSSSIRRKSADPLTNAPGYAKVSYKIDINELVSGQNWHGLRAVSLDNGDDQDVVSEGLAWYLHRLASGPEGYGYDAGLASWVRLVINGVDTGVYVNAEQRDKRFLENRGLWVERRDLAVRGRRPQRLRAGRGRARGQPHVHDPLLLAVRVAELVPDARCRHAWRRSCRAWSTCRACSTLAAVDAFSANPDAIFSHGKNFYFVDYLSGAPRLHFPWDLDSALGGGGVNGDVYAPQ